MGNKDYLSGGCENDYMIMPENFNKKLELKKGP